MKSRHKRNLTLSALIQLLIDYEKDWSIFYRVILGDHIEAAQLKIFLSRYHHQKDTYELTDRDIYDLLKLIPLNGDLKLVVAIREYFNPQFLGIFKILTKIDWINAGNFSLIYRLPREETLLLHDLFCGPLHIRFNKDIVDLILRVKDEPAYRNTVESLIRYLHNKNRLTSTAIKYITSNLNRLLFILPLFEVLEKIHYLNDSCLAYLSKHKSPDIIAGVINQLDLAGIVVNGKTIKLICDYGDIKQFNNILPYFINSNCHLNIEMVQLLLKNDVLFLFDKLDTLKFFQQHGLLDEKSFNYILHNNVFTFQMMLSVLADVKLLNENKILVSKIINNEFNHDDFSEVIFYLKSNHLLSQQMLSLLMDKPLIGVMKNKFVSKLSNLVVAFNNASFKINDYALKQILNLSYGNLERLYGMVVSLIKNNFLNQNSFKHACQRLTEKLSHPAESLVIKESKKDTLLPRSKITLDHKTNIYIDQSKHHHAGSFGKVRKGFETMDGNTPRFAVKKMLDPNLNDSSQGAKREVKYNQFFNRQASYFINNNVVQVVTEWQQGKSLEEYTPEELQHVSYEQRLRCLASGLSDLNYMHAHYRIHGDIKPSNYILDLSNLIMRLIDFGGAHKKGSNKDSIFTPMYIDPKNYKCDHFINDIYSMGFVAIQLFPEIYTKISKNNGGLRYITKNLNLTIIESAIIKLVKALMQPKITLRCTSEDALSYCNEIVEAIKSNSLNRLKLKQIADKTIERRDITLEDVLRDTMRCP